MMKPNFTHDCEACTFLGSSTVNHAVYDYYFCTQGGTFSTLIARYSNEGQDYLSGLAFGERAIIKLARREVATNPLGVAYVMAALNGLINLNSPID